MRSLVRLCLAVCVLAAGNAAASEEARLAVLGFAHDGSAFAFEQFGWSEGTSYPFSELAVISTESGKPIVGAPFTSLIAQSGATQESARLMSYTAAQRLLIDLDFDHPGEVVARGSGDPLDPAAATLSFDAPGLGRMTVKVDSAIVKSVGCDAAGVKVRALAVRLLDDQGMVLRDLYKEKYPPPERLCPVGYGLAELRLLQRPRHAPILAVIVGLNRPGASGFDRRYVGLTADLGGAMGSDQP